MMWLHAADRFKERPFLLDVRVADVAEQSGKTRAVPVVVSFGSNEGLLMKKITNYPLHLK